MNKQIKTQRHNRKSDFIPSLRFPEFRKAKDWKKNKLGNIGMVSMCKRIMKYETSNFGEIPFYKIGTFGKQADAYIQRKQYQKYKQNYSFPKKGDVLISAAGTIGKTVVYDGLPAYFQDSNIVWIANNEKLVKNNFLLYCYENVKWQTDDNTIPRLYNNNLRNMKVYFPALPEQQKIADCLSSLDSLISAQSKKIKALKAHKKGLMQKLFPAKGERMPKLRFPEFVGDWEIKSLSEICKIFSGGTPSTSKPEYWNGSIEWLTPAEMGKRNNRFISSTTRKLTALGLKKCSSTLLPINSVILSTRAPIGHLLINTSKMAINQGCKALVPKIKFSYNYLYYILLNEKTALMELGSGNTFKELSLNNLKKFKVIMPSFPEQQKIADCLSSLDDLINLESRTLELYKKHKKGLMQRLFPFENE